MTTVILHENPLCKTPHVLSECLKYLYDRFSTWAPLARLWHSQICQLLLVLLSPFGPVGYISLRYKCLIPLTSYTVMFSVCVIRIRKLMR